MGPWHMLDVLVCASKANEYNGHHHVSKHVFVYVICILYSESGREKNTLSYFDKLLLGSQDK
jgi:hypothetical protein